ncbi:MAG: hypothetical protein K2M46_01665 [Lachnospiraceae bacterium]|nr:hypothetical protein [Lachnospiraceae bacterium]
MKELALYIYPEPKGTPYYKENLLSEKMVEQLFDYYQILEALIYREGWDFLILHYGYERLFEINKRSECFDCDSLEEFIQYIEGARAESPRRG